MRYKENYGTCFTVDINNRRYILTAKHLVDQICNGDAIEIQYADSDTWKPVKVNLVGYDEDDIDIAVLASEILLGVDHPVTIEAGNITVSEEVHFLGYPYGTSFGGYQLNYGFPLPLVKRATVSVLDDKARFAVLDGHNTYGFSGGPVVRFSQDGRQIVFGIISSHHRRMPKAIPSSGEGIAYAGKLNVGIIFAYYCKNIEKIIAANPIGTPL